MLSLHPFQPLTSPWGVFITVSSFSDSSTPSRKRHCVVLSANPCRPLAMCLCPASLINAGHRARLVNLPQTSGKEIATRTGSITPFRWIEVNVSAASDLRSKVSAPHTETTGFFCVLKCKAWIMQICKWPQGQVSCPVSSGLC